MKWSKEAKKKQRSGKKGEKKPRSMCYAQFYVLT